jgi:hypothetical protein
MKKEKKRIFKLFLKKTTFLTSKTQNAPLEFWGLKEEEYKAPANLSA